MRYYVEESLSEFKFWSGAVPTADLLTEEQFDTVEQILMELEPDDGYSDTYINDLFWHDGDTIARWLGFKNETYLEKGILDNEIQEADDWFEGLINDELYSIAGLKEEDYIISNEGEIDEPDEVDYDFMDDDAQDWWSEKSDIEKVEIFRENNR